MDASSRCDQLLRFVRAQKQRNVFDVVGLLAFGAQSL
jgi:hypothetical protein